MEFADGDGAYSQLLKSKLLGIPLLPLRHWLHQTDMQGTLWICCGPPRGVIHSQMEILLNLLCPQCAPFSCTLLRQASFVPKQWHIVQELSCVTAGFYWLWSQWHRCSELVLITLEHCTAVQ